MTKIESREFDKDGKPVTHSKIQAGADLSKFNAKSLLKPKTNISRVLAFLDTSRNKLVGKAEIHKKTGINLNSLSPVLSFLYSLEFVDRVPAGKHTAIYRLKPDIDVKNAQDLYKRAIEAKNNEIDQNAKVVK